MTGVCASVVRSEENLVVEVVHVFGLHYQLANYVIEDVLLDFKATTHKYLKQLLFGNHSARVHLFQNVCYLRLVLSYLLRALFLDLLRRAMQVIFPYYSFKNGFDNAPLVLVLLITVDMFILGVLY